MVKGEKMKERKKKEEHFFFFFWVGFDGLGSVLKVPPPLPPLASKPLGRWVGGGEHHRSVSLLRMKPNPN